MTLHSDATPCPLCEQADGVEILNHADNVPDKWNVKCPRCGRFKIVGETRSGLTDRRDLHRLSGRTREHFERRSKALDIAVMPDSEGFHQLIAETPHDFDVAAKVRKLLYAVARKSSKPGASVKLTMANDYPLAYARDAEELNYFISYAVQMDWITSSDKPDVKSICIAPRGWEEAQHPSGVDSPTAFVAMWFHDSMLSIYEQAIRPAIEHDCGYRAVRVDREETNNDDIVDEILAQIRASRFVVADVTGARHGVYFEAGFAKGLGIPVIWTCRQDDFDESRQFDTEHYNHILWQDGDDLRRKLGNRVRGSIEIGPPYKSLAETPR
jgi:hypothetical protein